MEDFDFTDFEDSPGYRAIVVGHIKLVFSADEESLSKEIHLLIEDERVASAVLNGSVLELSLSPAITSGAHQKEMELFKSVVDSFQAKEVVAAEFRVELDTWEHADSRMPFGPTTYSEDPPNDPYTAFQEENPERLEELINRMGHNIKHASEPMDIFEERIWSDDWLKQPMTEEEYWEGE